MFDSREPNPEKRKRRTRDSVENLQPARFKKVLSQQPQTNEFIESDFLFSAGAGEYLLSRGMWLRTTSTTLQTNSPGSDVFIRIGIFRAQARPRILKKSTYPSLEFVQQIPAPQQPSKRIKSFLIRELDLTS